MIVNGFEEAILPARGNAGRFIKSSDYPQGTCVISVTKRFCMVINESNMVVMEKRGMSYVRFLQPSWNRNAASMALWLFVQSFPLPMGFRFVDEWNGAIGNIRSSIAKKIQEQFNKGETEYFFRYDLFYSYTYAPWTTKSAKFRDTFTLFVECLCNFDNDRNRGILREVRMSWNGKNIRGFCERGNWSAVESCCSIPPWKLTWPSCEIPVWLYRERQ